MHNQVIITGPKKGGPPPPDINVEALQSLLASMGGGKREMVNRALPYQDLCSMLTGMLGASGKEGAQVGQGNLHSSLTSLFGGDASGKSSQVNHVLTS